MSKDKPKVESPSVKTEQKKPQSSKGHAWPGFIALLSLVLVVLASSAGFYIYKKQIEPQTLAIEKQIANFQGAFSGTEQDLNSQRQLLNSVQSTLQEYQREEKSGDVLLSEAEYLVQLAIYNLVFEGNVTIAYQLLQAADERVEEMGGALSFPIRRALANDIVAISAVPKADLPGLVSRLNALSLRVETLPRAMVTVEEDATNSDNASQMPTTWKEKVAKTGSRMGEILSNLVVVSHDVPEAAPLLPPDQYIYVITNIQSKLAMAEWAALYRQPEIYKQSLGQAKDWVQRYFVAGNSQTAAFLKSIDELATASIKPSLPDLSDSLEQIELARGNQKPVESSGDQRQEADEPQSNSSTLI